MKSIVSIIVVAAVIACAMAMAPPSTRPQANGPQADHVATYEHLATAIIALRETENSLVHGMLAHHLHVACVYLEQAADARGADRTRLLEQAAAEITNLASEGDKRIQAVRQRLLKAGHHHHTDAETDDDYLFIDGREKSALLALAGDVARMGSASSDQIRATADRLTTLAAKAMRTG